jgi:outer membrane protein assembly factor BamD (BamD/ComL family)
VIELTEKLAESAYLQSDSYRRIGCLTCAVDYYETRVIALYPETSWTPKALLAMYKVYRELEWEEEAGETVDRLRFNFPDSASAQELTRLLEADGTSGDRE